VAASTPAGDATLPADTQRSTAVPDATSAMLSLGYDGRSWSYVLPASLRWTAVGRPGSTPMPPASICLPDWLRSVPSGPLLFVRHVPAGTWLRRGPFQRATYLVEVDGEPVPVGEDARLRPSGGISYIRPQGGGRTVLEYHLVGGGA
jgi:hypothetical protein